MQACQYLVHWSLGSISREGEGSRVPLEEDQLHFSVLLGAAPMELYRLANANGLQSFYRHEHDVMLLCCGIVPAAVPVHVL